MKPRDLGRQFFKDANDVINIAFRKYPTLPQQPGFTLLFPDWIKIEDEIEQGIFRNDESAVVFGGEELVRKTRTHLWNQVKNYGLKAI